MRPILKLFTFATICSVGTAVFAQTQFNSPMTEEDPTRYFSTAEGLTGKATAKREGDFIITHLWIDGIVPDGRTFYDEEMAKIHLKTRAENVLWPLCNLVRAGSLVNETVNYRLYFSGNEAGQNAFTASITGLSGDCRRRSPKKRVADEKPSDSGQEDFLANAGKSPSNSNNNDDFLHEAQDKEGDWLEQFANGAGNAAGGAANGQEGDWLEQFSQSGTNAEHASNRADGDSCYLMIGEGALLKEASFSAIGGWSWGIHVPSRTLDEVSLRSAVFKADGALCQAIPSDKFSVIPPPFRELAGLVVFQSIANLVRSTEHVKPGRGKTKWALHGAALSLSKSMSGLQYDEKSSCGDISKGKIEEILRIVTKKNFEVEFTESCK